MPSGIYQHKGGYKLSKEFSEKQSIRLKRQYLNGYNPVLGKHWKVKDTSKMKGHCGVYKHTPEMRTGKYLHKPHTEEWKKNNSELQKRRCLEGKHNFWKGGIYQDPYSVDWTEDLKRAIRKRDKYTCQICGKEPSIIVHHIDYNKLNSNSDNLVVVCKSCHSKTNGDRDYWKKNLQRNTNKII